jgi:hypothetical protein
LEANKRYKDSVFTLLFSDPRRLRELYNALAGTNYDELTDITINTLSDALFYDRVNDLSFTIGGKVVVLVEHQSTINPNMPVRLLSYIARIYETLVDSGKMYSKTALRIPRPEFIVLYNGIENYPGEAVLRLSDHFPTMPGHDNINLEPSVTVYNINRGHNPGLEQKSRSLEGYAAFVAKVREEQRSGAALKQAVKTAISWCLGQNILRDFLERHAMEVVNMMYAEWDLDVVKGVWYEDGLKDGLERGMEQGSRQSRLEIARNFKNSGLPAEQIAQNTGLSMEEIRTL